MSAGTSYTYAIEAVDKHNTASAAASVNVTTLETGSIDVRRVGMRGDGSYWGAAGESLDMRSGNLNLTLPVLSAQGRNGVGAGVALHYNSPNWRKDTSVWKLGRDVGYGFGWRLMIGSLTPVYSDILTVHHYVFADSTGVEYRLEAQSGGIWSSREELYVWVDPASSRLYFPDGGFWVMGAISGGTEEDAGTRYPTRIQRLGSAARCGQWSDSSNSCRRPTSGIGRTSF